MVEAMQDTPTPTSDQAARATTDSTMQAVVYDRYGSLDALQVRGIARPTAGRREVLVRVQAAALHVGDVFGVLGSPLVVRAITGWLSPKYGVPGFDIAGRVEAVGADVTGFHPGDEVFGYTYGACAQYARVKLGELTHKPARVSFEQAASLTTSGLAALHGLKRAAKLQPGQKLLINGAAGGVGSFAIQLAKLMGAEVTAVCSSANVDFVRQLGADHVVD
ncbi:MAG: NAD(P)-dependent alcohol dehydrogenase, partial [Polyangiales bacterium]